MNTVPAPRTRAFTAVALGLAASILLFGLLVYARRDHSQEVSYLDAEGVSGLTAGRVGETDPPFRDYDCQISILPTSPTQYDPIQVTVAGEWPDSCIPFYQSYQVVRNGIGIHFVHDPAPFCADVMTPWGDTADVGTLAIGAYTVNAYINGWRCDTKPFTVSRYPGCVTEFPMTLAAYQAWFGLDSHIKPPPYTSTEPTVISGHITAALAQGIDGFVVDWYGPEAGAVNDKDRTFIDRATSELLQQSGTRGFCVALMYDEGTVSTAETLTTAYTTRVISDLLYSRQYFTMPSYLHIDEHPALFVFPYDKVDPYVDWVTVTHQLGITVTLFDKDPNPEDPEHDSLFDGFYAWVQPTDGQWSEDGAEWGKRYLTWFYDTMATPSYTNSVTVGGVWPGFDDTLASWGQERYMWRRCGQTWRDTWQIAEQYSPPIVMIDTWNDFEEGTDIEYGSGECVAPSRQGWVLPGDQTVYTHTIANTGKFTDTFYISAVSSRAWPFTMMMPITTKLVGHASVTLAVSLTVPETASCGTWDRLAITATSGLSTAVHSSVFDTTTVIHVHFLPVVLKDWP